MKIAIIGYGRMGKTVERLALKHGDTITCRIDVDNTDEFNSEAFRSSDVAIEFSIPATARENVMRALRAGVPVVSGTTGWKDSLPEVEEECKKLGGSLMWSSNFSVGVNIFMAVNRRLTRIMSAFPSYRPHIVETHHIHKLDHPSGTAVTLADDIVELDPGFTGWQETDDHEQLPDNLLPVNYIRVGEVPGIHTVTWNSDVDDITITHTAKSRDGFAKGAILAARWLVSHPGVRNFKEMLSDLTDHDLFD